MVSSQTGVEDHPRIRGEHKSTVNATRQPCGSSPHTRGAPTIGLGKRPPPGIIPAYAGSTGAGSPRMRIVGDHPRIRGEHPVRSAKGQSGPGSSPHTRGALRWRRPSYRRRRIIPAYAGSTSRRRRARGQAPDHPRIRGEHRHDPSGQVELEGSSPHTRGAPRTLRRGRRPGRIIPAYAGSTPACPRS